MSLNVEQLEAAFAARRNQLKPVRRAQPSPTREEIIAANPFETFLANRGFDLRDSGQNRVTNACPVAVHKKYHRPVTIDMGKQLWHCNDCKVGGTVIEWVARENDCDAAGAMRILTGGRTGSERRGRLIKTYDYTDETGRLLFQTCRYEPKDFRQRRPNGKAGWIWNLKGTRRVLYRLSAVIAAQEVVIAEGEKDCDKLTKLGFTASCNPCGGEKWRDEYSETLRGKDVAVFWDRGDKDGKGERHAEQVIASLTGKARSIKRVTLPEGFHDVSDYIASLPAASAAESIKKLIAETPILGTSGQAREPRIRFFTPSELRDFKPDNEIVLIGDCHVIRGEVFVIGGEPGVGKSLASTELAVCGATGRDWFGLKVHRKFRTLIVQTENGRYRLQLEFSKRECDEIEAWVRISEPPPFGLTLNNPEFQADISAALDSFKPECVMFDPWSAAARDDKQRDYVETFDALRNLLPTGSDKPALGVIAHTRKPQAKEKRTGGTGLMHLLAGSYVLTSVPRSIFIMTRGSEDEMDNSVVLFNPKNSNGQNAPRSAWIRALNGFAPATDFDWPEFDQAPEERKIISLDQISKVFDGGKKLLYKNEAAHDLATVAGVRDTSAYRALKLDGKFAKYLSTAGEKLKFSLPSSLGILGERKNGF